MRQRARVRFVLRSPGLEAAQDSCGSPTCVDIAMHNPPVSDLLVVVACNSLGTLMLVTCLCTIFSAPLRLGGDYASSIRHPYTYLLVQRKGAEKIFRTVAWDARVPS